jgi:hypothetical protein
LHFEFIFWAESFFLHADETSSRREEEQEEEQESAAGVRRVHYAPGSH